MHFYPLSYSGQPCSPSLQCDLPRCIVWEMYFSEFGYFHHEEWNYKYAVCLEKLQINWFGDSAARKPHRTVITNFKVAVYSSYSLLLGIIFAKCILKLFPGRISQILWFFFGLSKVWTWIFHKDHNSGLYFDPRLCCR